MAKGSDNDFPSLLFTEQSSAPTKPAAGKRRIYWKTDNKFYVRDESGTETEIGGGAGSDTTAIHDNVASEISAVTEKTTPVSADLLLIEDSADSNNKKRVQIGNLPASGADVFGFGTLTDPPAVADWTAMNAAAGWAAQKTNNKLHMK